MTPRRSVVALAAFATLAAAPRARAADAKAAEAATERGRGAFEVGRFAEARDAFQQALDALPVGSAAVPRTLYNLARAEQELGEHCAAADRFARYLELAEGLGPAEKNRVEKAGAAANSERAACAETQSALEASSPPSAAPVAVDARATSQAAPLEPGSESGGAGPWSWITAGGAVVFVGAGVVLNLAARGQVEEGDREFGRFTDSGRRDADAAGRSRAAYDDAGTYGTASLVTLGVGVALVGVSTWLFLRTDATPGGAPSDGQARDGPAGLGVWRF